MPLSIGYSCWQRLQRSRGGVSSSGVPQAGQAKKAPSGAAGALQAGVGEQENARAELPPVAGEGCQAVQPG